MKIKSNSLKLFIEEHIEEALIRPLWDDWRVTKWREFLNQFMHEFMANTKGVLGSLDSWLIWVFLVQTMEGDASSFAHRCEAS